MSLDLFFWILLVALIIASGLMLVRRHTRE